MVEFPVNPTRFDPYKNAKFHVKWDGVLVPRPPQIALLPPGRDGPRHPGGGLIDPPARSRVLTAPAGARPDGTVQRCWRSNRSWPLGRSHSGNGSRPIQSCPTAKWTAPLLSIVTKLPEGIAGDPS